MTLVANVAGLGMSIAIATGLWDMGSDGDTQSMIIRATGAAGALGCVMIVLVLPRTRRHFGSVSFE